MRKVDPAKHEAKRQQILAAAGHCFAKSGFRGASISDICAEAGIRSGNLYHYFDSKEAIVEAMVEASLSETAEAFAQLQEGDDPLLPLFTEAQQFLKEAARGHRAIAIEIFAEAARNPTLEKAVRKHTETMRELLAGTIRRAQEKKRLDQSLNPEFIAGLLLSLFDGLKTLPIRNSKIDPQQTLESFKTLLAKFLAPASRKSGSKRA